MYPAEHNAGLVCVPEHPACFPAAAPFPAAATRVQLRVAAFPSATAAWGAWAAVRPDGMEAAPFPALRLPDVAAEKLAAQARAAPAPSGW